MPVRKASAVWNGTLKEGNGTMKMQSGAYEGKYSFGSRFEEDPGTNPEELIAAAHAGCFSMALSGGLTKSGFTPERVETSAKAHLEKVGEGFKITRIQLDVPGDRARDRRCDLSGDRRRSQGRLPGLAGTGRRRHLTRRSARVS